MNLMPKIQSVPSIPCPVCGVFLRLASFFPKRFFDGNKIKCSSCCCELDLWDYAINILKKKPQLFRNMGAAFIGGQEISFSFQLPPEGVAEIDLVDHGVPSDAKLIYVIYTPHVGAGWPIEMRDNQPLRRRDNHKFHFYGRPSPAKIDSNNLKYEVGMSVTFIPKSPDQPSFEGLVNAFEQFMGDDFESTIIPSAVALEVSIERLVFECLFAMNLNADLSPSKRLALEVILPLICRYHRIPLMPEHIQDQVIKLWALRNQMAHQGQLKKKISHTEAATLLCAAMFSVNYFIYLREVFGQEYNKNTKN